jgi:hypothetical protein
MTTTLTQTWKMAPAALLLCLGAGGCPDDRPAPQGNVAQAEPSPPAFSGATPTPPSAAATDPGPASMDPAGAGPPSAKEVNMNLEDATVAQVLQVLQNLSGKPVEITPEAQPIADCATVTIRNPDKMPIATALNQIVRAVRPSGLIVERAPGGWKVRAAADAPPCSAKPGSSAGAGGKATSPLLLEAAAGIRSPSTNHFDVTEATRQLILDEQKELLATARWIPEREGEAQVGVRVFGVRAGGLLDRLGIENGDRILSVGGTLLDSPENEAKAKLSLRTAKETTVLINRRGGPVTLHYRISSP